MDSTNDIKNIGANEPALLDNPDEILLIKKGFADVFAVLIDENNNYGKRFHLFRVSIGSALFGIKSSKTNIRLLAVALNDTLIQKYPATILIPDVSSDNSHQPKIAVDHLYLLEDWIKNLIKAVSAIQVAHKKLVYIEHPISKLKVDEVMVSPDHRLHWVKVKTGKLSLNCYKDLVISEDNNFFPFLNYVFI